MYSNSNSFLGGNSVRPGVQHYGSSFGMQQAQQGQQAQAQQAQQVQPMQPMQQQGPFASQPTGFGQPLQQQFTGFPAAGLQQGQRTGLQSQATSFQQPQPMGFLPAQAAGPALPAVKPQATGFSEMAASFQTAGSVKPTGRRTDKTAVKIPNIRLSFITAQDQAKFEALFRSAVGDAGHKQNIMSGPQARDLLLRSRLDGDSLSHIWTLADTTRSGQLHFPEFALAMYLCNLKLTGKTLPSSLPENIKNEVSSMVDIINFSIAEEAAGNATELPSMQQPQPQSQPSHSHLLQTQMAQTTGFPLQQTMGQNQGLQTQPTGFPAIGPQLAGYPQPPMPPMPPMLTAYASNLAPLNAQATGRPGQWGLVNAPATGLPNIDALQARMMPQQGREHGSYTTVGLQGNAVIPWAITKEEKTRYDSLFRAWDGLNKGYIGGAQAIEIMGQSGLEKAELERIWTLADNGNKGRLDLDEFAVAMHLIYRKLNGYPIPNQLPPELVPPSTRTLTESLGKVKSMLHQESESRKNSGATLLPQKTGVSYLKKHSFRPTPAVSATERKDATMFRNNDEEVGYRSSARRRIGNDSPVPDSPSPSTASHDMTVAQLRKKVKERQIVLDAMHLKDDKDADEDDALNRRARREAEELYRRIRKIQDEIDHHPDSATTAGADSEAERRALGRQLQKLTDRMPELTAQARKTEKAIADARLELFRLRDAKTHAGSALVGTGPGGSLTESDRLKARAKAMMQQRTAALTGKKIEAGPDDGRKRLEEESTKIRTEMEKNEGMVRDVEESVRDFGRRLEDSLDDSQSDSTSHEKRRWEDGLGVGDEVRDFIFELQRSSRAARNRAQERTRQEETKKAEDSLSSLSSQPERTVKAVTGSTTNAGGSYSAYKTAEERAAFIKQQAEQRMAERLQALGMRAASKPGETLSERIEREKTEREAKLRQAEEEDACRETELKARLAEETGELRLPGPSGMGKKPAPRPPKTRKGAGRMEERRAEEEGSEDRQEEDAAVGKDEDKDEDRDEDELAREQADARLQALEEQVRLGKLRKEEEKRRKKAALASAKEKESREKEARERDAKEKEAREKEAKLAARRAEMEANRKREEELRRQLESINDNSSSDESESEQQIMPQASTPTLGGSQVGSQEEVKGTPPPLTTAAGAAGAAAAAAAAATAPPPPPPSPPAPPQTTSPESRNPYFRMMTHSSESTSTSSQTASAAPAPPQPDVSTNPFLRTGQPAPAASSMPPPPTGSFARPKRGDNTDDEWGSDKDSDSDEDSDDDRPRGTSAAQLASILFGTMAPPRPLSAAGNRSPDPSHRPEATAGPKAPTSPPPPPPPVEADSSPPGAFPPSPPPGPPPPLPSVAPPPPPPPPPPTDVAPMPPPSVGRPAGLLGEIQKGKALKKTQTKDKSVAAVAGRVLE